MERRYRDRKWAKEIQINKERKKNLKKGRSSESKFKVRKWETKEQK